jgi:hypothetical protein
VSDPISNNEQMYQAMRDPRYRNDPEYREQVKKRIAAGRKIHG